MDNCGSPHRSAALDINNLEKIHISSPADSDDSDIDKFYSSDSEPEFSSSPVLTVQYKLPQRKHSMNHSSLNRSSMDRMAAFNKSVRMKHGTTALDIIVPLNRNTTTPLKNVPTTSLKSETTHRNLTTSLNIDSAQNDITTQVSIPAQNALPASSLYVPTKWMFPSIPTSLTMPASYKSQVPTLPSTVPSSSPPPLYLQPSLSNTSRTSTFSKNSQFSTTSYPTTTNSPRSSMLTFSSRTDSMFYNSSYSSLSYTPLFSTLPNISQTSKYHKRSQYRTPPYIPPYSCPPYTSLSSSLIHTSEASVTSNTSQTSISSIRTQSSVSSYNARYLTPIDSTLSFVPKYTPQTSTIFNTSQNFTYYTRSRSSTPSYGLPYSTPSYSSIPSIYSSRSSKSIYNLTPSSVRTKSRSAHYSAAPTYSHYTFPRSSHYTMPVSETYCTVAPQLSTRNSYNVWPTKIGSVMQASMQNICSVLEAQSQNSLPPSNTTRLQNASRPSTTTQANENNLLAPITTRANDQLRKCVNLKPSNSIMTATNSSCRKRSEQLAEKLMMLPIHDIEKKDIYFDITQQNMKMAWIYFSKMEIVDIKPNGEIKCICPTIKFEDLLKSSIKDKIMLVNLYYQFQENNHCFETSYDYNSTPHKTIVTEGMENNVHQWLSSQKMEEYDWFFNSLSLIEIENINPTNIHKFIVRSKSNKTISLEDQLKICCMVKKIKERPVSLLAILMNLRDDRIDKKPFQSTVMPFIIDILLFPFSIKNYEDEDLMRKSYFLIMRMLITDIMNLLNEDLVPDINIIMGDLPNIKMVSSDIVSINQSLQEFNFSCT